MSAIPPPMNNTPPVAGGGFIVKAVPSRRVTIIVTTTHKSVLKPLNVSNSKQHEKTPEVSKVVSASTAFKAIVSENTPPGGPSIVNLEAPEKTAVVSKAIITSVASATTVPENTPSRSPTVVNLDMTEERVRLTPKHKARAPQPHFPIFISGKTDNAVSDLDMLKIIKAKIPSYLATKDDPKTKIKAAFAMQTVADLNLDDNKS